MANGKSLWPQTAASSPIIHRLWIPQTRAYTVAELKSNNTDLPYPNAEMNSPLVGRINYTTTPPTGANYQTYRIGVQSVVIDPANRLWILDTGRAATPSGAMVPASFGGPKLIGVNLATNEIFTTIVFSPPAHRRLPQRTCASTSRPRSRPRARAWPTSPTATPMGCGALVAVDPGARTAWRHLVNNRARAADARASCLRSGCQPVYPRWDGARAKPIGNFNFRGGRHRALGGRVDAVFLDDGRELYSVPTERLRDDGPYSELRADGPVQYLGQKGLSDGLETESNGLIYCGNMKDNSIVIFRNGTGAVELFVSDPRFSWTDTMSVATDGYLYFTENQLWRGSGYTGGVDKMVKPFVLFRVELPGGGTKVTQPAPCGA